MKTKIFIAILMICVLFGCTTREAMVISANIGGEEEVPPVETLAFGAFYGVVGRDQDFMAVRVTVSCIDSVIAAHLHYAPAGENGNVIVTLFNDKPVRDPQRRFSLDLEINAGNFEGEALTWTFEEFLNEVISGNCYVNIHTVKHKGGEVRGQLEKFR